MAIKRSVFFRRVQSILKKATPKKRRLVVVLILQALLGLFLVLSIQLVAVGGVDSTDAGVTSANTIELVQSAEKLYNEGQFAEAVSVWQQAADAYAKEEDSLNEAMALSNLSLSYQRLGEWKKGGEAIARASGAITVGTNNRR